MGAVHEQQKMRSSVFVSITALMTSLALVGLYTLVTVPNVELGSLVLFVTAYVFGFQMAIWVTLIMSILFGVINPWGGFIPQIWITQVIGWLFMTTVGALLKKNPTITKEHIIEDYRLLAGAGAVTTIFFDLITNLGYSWAFGVPYYVALIAGLFPFMIIHVVSNTILFALVAPQLSVYMREYFADRIWISEPKEMTLSEQ